jgi:hypothetical protein
VTAEGDHAGASVADVGEVAKGAPGVLVGAPGFDNSAGGAFVVYGHRGRNQGTISLDTLPDSLGTLSDGLGTAFPGGNPPLPQTHPYANHNPARDAAGNVNPQILERTEELAFYDKSCSNYTVEHGDQAGTALAGTGTGIGGFALIGAPSYGESNQLTWNGSPANPTVWFSDGRNGTQVGQPFGDNSTGEADWAVSPGSGAAYVVGF